MSDAPAWVSYAALVLAALSLVLAGLTYRAGGPRLRLEAWVPADDNEGVVNLTVFNTGRSAVTVDGFHVAPYGNRRTVFHVSGVMGRNLPYRLEAHASETWTVDALPVAQEYDALVRSGKIRRSSSWPPRFCFTVEAGHGKRARDRRTFDALRLIAHSKS